MNKINFIFPFIRYVKPIWYFNIFNAKGNFCWVDYNKLPKTMRNNISYDKNYSSIHASQRDAAFQILTSAF